MSEPPKRCGFSKECVATRLPRAEVVETERYGRGADVDREAVERAVRLRERLAVEQHVPAVACHGRIEAHAAIVEAFGLGLDPERAAPQRVAADLTRFHEPRAAGEPEAAFEVALLRRRRREQLGARLDLDQALAALALLDARRRHVNAERLGTLEERLLGPELARDAVDRQRPVRLLRAGDGRAHVASTPAAGALAAAASCSAIRRWKSCTALAASAA